MMVWMDAKQMLLQMYAKVDVGFVVDDKTMPKVDVGFVVDDVDDKTMPK